MDCGFTMDEISALMSSEKIDRKEALHSLFGRHFLREKRFLFVAPCR